MQIIIRRAFVPTAAASGMPTAASPTPTAPAANGSRAGAIPPPLVLFRPLPNQVRVYRYRDDADALSAVANIPPVADWGFDAAATSEWNAEKPISWYVEHVCVEWPPSV